MAKTRHQPEPSSGKGAMALMAAGGVLVGALVVWALTRTVEPAQPAPATSVVATSGTSTTAAPSTAETPSTTQPISSTSAVPSIPTATNAPPPPQPHGDRSSVPRIAVEDLRAKLGRGEVTVIDVRDANSYNARHIPGALHVPFASIETMLDQIPKDKPIVTYCT